MPASFAREVAAPFLTVFIPAYNEEGNLANCVEAILGQMNTLGISVEILIVDDGSRDNTSRLSDEIAEKNPCVRVIHHPNNQGIGAGFMTARANARGKWLILIPADLALYPSELSHYIKAAQNADIVIGLRSDRSDYTLLRKIVSYTNIFLIRFLFGMSPRQYQYISMYRMEALRAMEITCTQSAFFLAEILIHARDQGCRLVEVPIHYAPRLSGKPTGAKFMLIVHTVRDLIRFWFRWRFNRR